MRSWSVAALVALALLAAALLVGAATAALAGLTLLVLWRMLRQVGRG